MRTLISLPIALANAIPNSNDPLPAVSIVTTSEASEKAGGSGRSRPNPTPCRKAPRPEDASAYGVACSADCAEKFRDQRTVGDGGIDSVISSRTRSAINTNTAHKASIFYFRQPGQSSSDAAADPKIAPLITVKQLALMSLLGNASHFPVFAATSPPSSVAPSYRRPLVTTHAFAITFKIDSAPLPFLLSAYAKQ